MNGRPMATLSIHVSADFFAGSPTRMTVRPFARTIPCYASFPACDAVTGDLRFFWLSVVHTVITGVMDVWRLADILSRHVEENEQARTGIYVPQRPITDQDILNTQTSEVPPFTVVSPTRQPPEWYCCAPCVPPQRPIHAGHPN